MSQKKTSLVQHVLRFLRGSAVGLLATGADLLVLALLVEGFGLVPTVANVPALIVGALVQFIGCRLVVFRSSRGSITRQLAGFALAEAGTLALNGVLFHLLVSMTPVPYALARTLGTFLVFVGFSYPAWVRVFRDTKAAVPTEPAPATTKA